jgi:hypothetical protein
MLKTLTITQGDTRHLRVPLLKGKVRCPVVGWAFWFTVKAAASDPDASAAIQKSTAAGTVRTLDATAVYVTLSPADTKTVAPGKYLWDLQGKSATGDIFTLERGYLVIAAEITQAE